MFKRFKIDLILIFIALSLIGYEFYLLNVIKSDVSILTAEHTLEHESKIMDINNDSKLIEFSGYLTKMEISNPDVGFSVKYILTLKDPILVENQTGLGLLYEKNIELKPSSHKNLDNYLEKYVKVAGTMNWGYAHSRVLEIQDIIEL